MKAVEKRGPLGRLSVAVVVLAALATSGCPSPCGNLQSASSTFNAKAAPCFGDGGYPGPAVDGGSGDAGVIADGGVDAGSPDAGAGVPTSAATFNDLVCENDVTDCSKNDIAVLNRYASCLTSLPACSPETQQSWSSSVEACTNELSSLTGPCAAALSGNGNAGN
jgi:hypothetical protein